MVDRTITLIREDGKEIIADILFTYHSDDFSKDYVVFQVRETGDISAASYTQENGGTGNLDRVETEEEWEMLEELLNDYANENNVTPGCGGGCAGCHGCDSCDEDCDCEGCDSCEK